MNIGIGSFGGFGVPREHEAAQPIRAGDYLHSDRELFCVVELNGDRVLLEDCRNGALIDAGLPEVRRLERVRRSAPAGDGIRA